MPSLVKLQTSKKKEKQTIQNKPKEMITSDIIRDLSYTYKHTLKLALR